MKLVFAAWMAVYLLTDPASAMNRAREAMLLWARSVAPALFPFMALLPALTDEYALNVYEKLFGRIAIKLFRVSGKAASCMIVGLAAGSPAGAMAIQRARADGGLTVRECEIASAVACGASPVFVISSVGANMFLSYTMGIKLLACAWISSFTGAFLLSRMPYPRLEGAIETPLTYRRPGAVQEAVTGILTVCGYMVVFYVFAGWLPGAVYQAFEISFGCMYASRIGSLPLAGGVIAFGGICAISQNLGWLRKAGVRVWVFLAIKASEGVACAALVKISRRIRLREIHIETDTYDLACVCALVLAALMAVSAGVFRHRKQRI